MIFKEVKDADVWPGEELYHISAIGNIPDDDGKRTFSFWVSGKSESDVYTQAEQYLQQQGEGAEVSTMDREEVVF